jgi:hypothetical protein
MLLIGYFENIDSQRGIAWRCDDSRSLRKFLGYAADEETPDHSSLSRIKGRLPLEVFRTVFNLVLELVHEHKLLDAKAVGVDATTLEADAAMTELQPRPAWWELFPQMVTRESYCAPHYGDEVPDCDCSRPVTSDNSENLQTKPCAIGLQA